MAEGDSATALALGEDAGVRQVPLVPVVAPHATMNARSLSRSLNSFFEMSFPLGLFVEFFCKMLTLVTVQ